MNIAYRLKKQAQINPFKKAVVYSCGEDKQGRGVYSHLTFSELEERSNGLAHSLFQLGIRKNQKVLLFVKPSLELPLLAFALFKIGAILILIDPGIGVKALRKSLRELNCEILIAPYFVHWLSIFFTGFNAKPKFAINTSTRMPAFAHRFLKILKNSEKKCEFPICNVLSTDLAAIIYTSGATGPSQGVAYTHEIFDTQIDLLSALFPPHENIKDLAGFPLFSLTAIAMGLTSYIPELNPTKPAYANPEKLVRIIHEQGITTASGSPAIWRRVLNHCQNKKINLPSLRALFMFGAPVEAYLIEGFANILPNGTTYTPYGATECLPVSCIKGNELLGEKIEKSRKGLGICIGSVVDKTRLKVIEANTVEISSENEMKELGPYQIGELVVQGKQVTPYYVSNAQATAFAKIPGKLGLWHRMGDLGYFDENGQIWFCGRKKDVVFALNQTFYSVPCESIFLNHSEIANAALIQVNDKRRYKPAIVLQRKDKRTRLNKLERKKFLGELLHLSHSFSHTKGIEIFFLHESFPVDRRHNIKIDRRKLQDIFKNKSAFRL